MGDFNPAYLAALVALIGLNAFFVAAEFALVSVRRTRMQELSEQGSRFAPLVISALDDMAPMLATVQVGITMSGLGIGYLGEPAISAALEDPFASIGLSSSVASVVAFLTAFLLMTWATVVVGELLPKTISLQKTESVAFVVIRPMHLLRRLFAPLNAILAGSLAVLLRVFKLEPTADMHLIHSEEELKLLVSQSSKGGVLEDSEQEMLYNVFDFADKDVAEVMVPRPDVTAFPLDQTVPELMAAIAEQPYTRYPIYRGSMDDVVGILHIRDLFHSVEREGPENVHVEALLRPAHVVPESKSLAGLLADFRRSRGHMALVVDEYGSLAGIVTLEDLLEEIVGEIDDEHDLPERPVEKIADGHVRVDGKFSLEELNERFDLDLPVGEFHTIGGFVFGKLGQQPHEGDVVRHGHVRMEVVEIDGARIVHVDIIMGRRRTRRGEGGGQGDAASGPDSGFEGPGSNGDHADDDAHEHQPEARDPHAGPGW